MGNSGTYIHELCTQHNRAIRADNSTTVVSDAYAGADAFPLGIDHRWAVLAQRCGYRFLEVR